MNETDQIMRRLGLTILLAPLVVGLPIALFSEGINVPVFLAVASLWLVVALILVLGPSSIMEVSFGSAAIRRDVQDASRASEEARQARDEAMTIRDDLRKLARLQIENMFVLNSLVAGIYKQEPRNAQHPGIQHVEQNLDKLTPLVSNDPKLVTAWQQSMRDLMKTAPNYKL